MQDNNWEEQCDQESDLKQPQGQSLTPMIPLGPQLPTVDLSGQKFTNSSSVQPDLQDDSTPKSCDVAIDSSDRSPFSNSNEPGGVNSNFKNVISDSEPTKGQSSSSHIKFRGLKKRHQSSFSQSLIEAQSSNSSSGQPNNSNQNTSGNLQFIAPQSNTQPQMASLARLQNSLNRSRLLKNGNQSATNLPHHASSTQQNHSLSHPSANQHQPNLNTGTTTNGYNTAHKGFYAITVTSPVPGEATGEDTTSGTGKEKSGAQGTSSSNNQTSHKSQQDQNHYHSLMNIQDQNTTKDDQQNYLNQYHYDPRDFEETKQQLNNSKASSESEQLNFILNFQQDISRSNETNFPFNHLDHINAAAADTGLSLPTHFMPNLSCNGNLSESSISNSGAGVQGSHQLAINQPILRQQSSLSGRYSCQNLNHHHGNAPGTSSLLVTPDVSNQIGKSDSVSPRSCRNPTTSSLSGAGAGMRFGNRNPSQHKTNNALFEETSKNNQKHDLTLRSPRLSPLPNINDVRTNSRRSSMTDNMGFSAKLPRVSNDNNSIFSNGAKSSVANYKNVLPETINEDENENEPPVFERQSRLREIRDHNEFGSSKTGQKRFKSDDRGKRRQKHGLRTQANRYVPPVLTLPSAYVSETDEEDSVSSGELNNLNNPSRKWLTSKYTSDNHARKKKTKVLTLSHLSQLINKRLFSDDYDKESSDTSHHNRNRQPGHSGHQRRKQFAGTLSMVDQPIKEGSEMEEADYNKQYMSDSSSNSQFSLRRKMQFNLEKFIDKLEPSDSQSAFGSKNYYGNVVNDTIQEEEISEHDEENAQDDSGSFLSSNSARRKRGYSMLDGPINPLSLNFVRQKGHRISKSVIDFQEYETIQEELEEYEFQNIQPPLSRLQKNNHCFKLPARFRAASIGTDAELNKESTENSGEQLDRPDNDDAAVVSEPNDSITGLFGSAGDQKSGGSMSTAPLSGERHSNPTIMSQGSGPILSRYSPHSGVSSQNLFFELAYKSGKKKGLQRTHYKGKRNKLHKSHVQSSQSSLHPIEEFQTKPKDKAIGSPTQEVGGSEESEGGSMGSQTESAKSTSPAFAEEQQCNIETEAISP